MHPSGASRLIPFTDQKDATNHYRIFKERRATLRHPEPMKMMTQALAKL